MRKFKRTFRVASEKVQGEGSFVVFQNQTWAEWRQVPENTTAAEAAALRVVEWNWTDEDGNPLPLPRDKPEIMAELMREEMTFLFEACNGAQSDAEKN